MDDAFFENVVAINKMMIQRQFGRLRLQVNKDRQVFYCYSMHKMTNRRRDGEVPDLPLSLRRFLGLHSASSLSSQVYYLSSDSNILRGLTLELTSLVVEADTGHVIKKKNTFFGIHLFSIKIALTWVS